MEYHEKTQQSVLCHSIVSKMLQHSTTCCVLTGLSCLHPPTKKKLPPKLPQAKNHALFSNKTMFWLPLLSLCWDCDMDETRAVRNDDDNYSSNPSASCIVLHVDALQIHSDHVNITTNKTTSEYIIISLHDIK